MALQKFTQQAKSLLASSLSYVLLSLGAGIANYLFFPVAKHYLGLERFGNVTVFTSIIAVFGALLIAHQLYAISYFPGASHKSQLDIMTQLRGKALVFCGYFSVIYLPAGLLLFRALGIHDMSSYILIFVYFWLMVVANLVSSYWHAKNHLGKLAAFTLSTSVLQLLLVAFMLAQNQSAYMTVGSLLLGQLLTLMIVLIRFPDTRHFIIRKSSISTHPKHLNELFMITLPIIGLYILLNSDVFLSKLYLGDSDAGYYGAFSTILRVIFFIVAPLVGVFLPRMALAKGKNFGGELRTLARFSLITIVATWLMGILLYPKLFKLLFNLTGNNSLYFLLLPAVLVNTCAYIATFAYIIKRKYSMALKLVTIDLVCVFLVSLFLKRSLTIAPLALSLGGLGGIIFIALSNKQYLVKRS